MRSVPRWAWALWIAAGLALEAWALATREAGDTLTETLVATVPGVIVIGFLTWALQHFVERYKNR